MYKHWEEQKKKLIEIITAGKSAACQVCYGTNYSIFFRNFHADLLLKKSILPIYIDINHLAVQTIESFLSLAQASSKRSLLEKKISLRTSSEEINRTNKELIEELITESATRNLNIVFFIEDFEKAKKISTEILALFEELKKKSEKCSVIYLTKTNISHPIIKESLNFTHLHENVVYFPIKDEKTLKAIEVGTSPKLLKIIYALTGGVDKFVGVATDLKNNLSTKERRNIKRHITSNWHLRQELNRLWDTLSESEAKAITNIVLSSRKLNEDYSVDVEHLVNIGLLVKKGKSFDLTIGLLKNTGYERASKEATKVDYKGDKVIVNGNKVSVKLTDIEKKILKQFVNNKNKIVARKMIARSIWKNEAKYNDFEIDDTITKLKTKLQEAWINPSNFITIDGRGYVYKEAE